MKANRPIVILAFDGIGKRTALRMALDARVVRVDVVHARRILDIGTRRARYVFAAGPVASFAAHIPFREAVIVKIEIYGMTTVAGSARGPLEIVGRVEGRPPIGAISDEVWPPDMVHDVPLRWLRIIIVGDLREVALLPDATVNKPHIVASELLHIIGVQVRNDRFGMFTRVTYYVGHGRLLPSRINIGVAGLAGPRAHITRRQLSLCCA